MDDDDVCVKLKEIAADLDDTIGDDAPNTNDATKTHDDPALQATDQKIVSMGDDLL